MKDTPLKYTGTKDLENVTLVKQEYLIEIKMKEKGICNLKDKNRAHKKEWPENLDLDGYLFKNRCTCCKDHNHNWYVGLLYNKKSNEYEARKKLEEKAQDSDNYISDDSDDKEIEDRDLFD